MTAVEWLEENIEYKNQGGCRYVAFDAIKLENIFQQAKEMEKQQIINARVNGVCEGIDIGGNPITEDISKNHEIYYNETFKKK